MKTPSHYLVLKPILNQTLFCRDNVEDYFKTEQRLAFSEQFVNYHAQFIDDPRQEHHELLLLSLYEYCKGASVSGRSDIMKVIMENEHITQAIIFASCLNKGKLLEFDKAMLEFFTKLNKFVKKGGLDAQLISFFTLFFRNLENINPKTYSNYEVNKSEYIDLISQYLRRQMYFSFA